MALAGCGGSDPLGAGLAAAGGADAISLERALNATLRPSGPGAAEAFLGSLPAPRAVHERSVPNRQDSTRRDTLRTLVFQGIAITVYRVSASGKRFPVKVAVTAERFRAPDGLAVGLDRDHVRTILGPPTSATSALWRYQRPAPPGAAPFELRVHFQNGHVTALVWLAYVD